MSHPFSGRGVFLERDLGSEGICVVGTDGRREGGCLREKGEVWWEEICGGTFWLGLFCEGDCMFSW